MGDLINRLAALVYSGLEAEGKNPTKGMSSPVKKSWSISQMEMVKSIACKHSGVWQLSLH